MAIKCPNKNLKEWKDLVDSVGETKAYGVWNAYEQGASISKVKSVKIKTDPILGNPNAFKSMKVPDSNKQSYEKELGFTLRSGKRRYFDSLTEANNYLMNIPREKRQFVSRYYKINKSKAELGDKNYKYIKHILTLTRKNASIIEDSVYGEFDAVKGTKIKNYIFPNKTEDNSQNVLIRAMKTGLLSEDVMEIAELLLDLNIPIEFVNIEGDTLMDTDGTVIRINNNVLKNAHPQLVAEGIVHELVHVKTVESIENPQTEAEIFLSRRVNILYNQFKRLDTENRYGGTNQVEFVAELLAKKEFRDYVKKLENGTIWQKFIRFLADSLGIPMGSRKLIADLSNLLSKDVKINKFDTVRMEVKSSTRNYLTSIINNVGTRLKTLEYRKDKTNVTEKRPSKEHLKISLQTQSHAEIAEIYGVSLDTVFSWENTDPKVYREYTFKKYQEILDGLQEKYNAHRDLEGVLEYLNVLEGFIAQFDEVSDKLRDDIESNNYDNILSKASNIRTLGTFITSNTHIIAELEEGMKAIIRENPESTAAIEDIKRLLGLASRELAQLRGTYKDAAKVIVAKFLLPFGLGRTLEHIEQVLSNPVRDIHIFKTQVGNMQETKDEALGMIDAALKNFYQEAATENLQFEKDILEKKKVLEENGIMNTDFLIKNESNYFITERNLVDYKNKMKEFAKTLPNVEDSKNPKQTSIDNSSKWGSFYKKYAISSRFAPVEFGKLINAKKIELGDKFDIWLSLNGIFNKDGSVSIPRQIDKSYANMHSNALKSDFYWTVIVQKYKVEKHLPENKKHLRRLPQMRKDFLERVKTGGWSRVVEIVKENLQRKEDDSEYGADYSLTDEAGDSINFLPSYFINKIDNPKDLSRDVTSSMIAYDYYYTRREKIATIVDMLELGKDVIKRRGVAKTSNRNKILNTVKSFTGDKTEQVQTIGPGNIYKRLESYIDMFVYGKEKAEGFKILGIDSEKGLDMLGKYTGLRTLAGNVYASLANVNVGTALSVMESVEGKFYDKEAFMYSEKEYWANMIGVLGDIGSRTATGKLTLWSEYMDSMNSIEERVYGVNAERKTKVGQLANSSAVFLTSKLPEHYLHNRISLAVARTYRFNKNTGRFVFKDDFFKEAINLDKEKIAEIKALPKSATKTEINNIRNSYDSKIKSTNDSLNKEWSTMTDYWAAWESKGIRLEIKEEFKNIHNKEDQNQFIARQHSVNNTIQGMYAKLDKSPVSKYALGRLALMFRKFFIPAWNRRFIGKYTDFEKQMEIEGYYRVMGNFISELAKDMRSGQYSIYKNWHSLNNEEKSAMLRVLQDYVLLMGVALLGAMLAGLRGEDDDNWVLNMASYQVNRLYTEIGTMIPGPNASEMFKILNAPAAGLSTVQLIGDSLDLLEWGHKIERGKYKDMYVFQRQLIKTVPMANTIYSLKYPEEKLKYFNLK